MKPEDKIFTVDTRGEGFFIALLFLALVFAWIAMSPCLDNGFTNWDEIEYIISNPKIKTLSWESVKTVFSSPDVGVYTPLSILSYAVEYHFAGLDPVVYHATNFLLHLANTALVMVLARLLLNGVWPAFFVALLFGIHPAHVESVAWAAERKDVLYAFFYLSSLIAYASRPYKAGTYLLSLALFICALLAKPMAVTLPLALLLIDYLKSEKLEVRHWLGKIPFFICAAVFVVIQLSWLGGTFGMHWAKRLLVPLYNLAFYIYTLLWPFNLSTMYVVPPGGKPVVYIFAAGALAGMFLLWKYFRRDKEIVFGAAFYVVMLLPVLQFFPFGGAISFDRFTYLSSIGIFIVGAVCARRLWRRPGFSYRSLAVVCTISAVLALAVTARVRCAVWKDGVSLWSDTLLKQPRAPYALINLCDAYLRADMAGEAAACVSRSIQIYPENNNNRYNMCRLLFLNKEFDGAEQCFAQTLKLSPCHAPALNYLGEIYFHKGEAEKAAQYYTRAAQCDGAYTAAYLNLGKLALLRKDKAKAVQYYEKALSSEPADKHIRALLNATR